LINSFNVIRFNGIRLFKEGSWIAVGQVVSFVGSLVLVRVLTEYLDPNQYGQLALGLTVSSLMNNVLIGGINNGISRFYSIAVEKNDLSGYLKDSLRLQIYVTIAVVAVGLVILVGLFCLKYLHWMGLAAAAVVFSVISGFNNSLNGIQSAARKRSIVALHSGLDSWLKILLALGFMHLLGHTGTAAVIGYICSSVTISVSQLFFLNGTIPVQQADISNHKKWTSQIWAFSWPFSAWGIFTWIQQVSDRWALEAFGTAADVGLYAVLFQISYSPIMLVSGIFVSFLSPILFQHAGDATDYSRIHDLKRITMRLSWFCLILTMMAFLLSAFFHKWIFYLILNEKFQDISYLMPWMVLAGGFMSAHHILGSRVASLLKTRQLAFQQILMCLFAAGLNLLGTMLFGLVGLVVAIVSFSFLYFLWMLWFTNNIISKETKMGILN
jgi:O-antigen/teichoic acid export membrane protein